MNSQNIIGEIQFLRAVSVVLVILFHFDLFGFKSQGIRNSGPFGDEMIAGGYLQKFSFFSFRLKWSAMP